MTQSDLEFVMSAVGIVLVLVILSFNINIKEK